MDSVDYIIDIFSRYYLFIVYLRNMFIIKYHGLNETIDIKVIAVFGEDVLCKPKAVYLQCELISLGECPEAKRRKGKSDKWKMLH